MENRRKRNWVPVTVALVAHLATTGTALADVAALEALQSANGALLHHWTFEGADDTARRADKVGSGPINLNVNTSSGFAPVQEFESISGSGSTSSRTYHGATRTTGSALQSASAVALPTSGTLEFLVRPGKVNDDAIAIGGLNGTGGNNRWYFYNNSGSSVVTTNARVTLGHGAAAANLFGTGTSIPYGAGSWYYVAHTWAITEATNITLNSYVADVSRGNARLHHAVVDLAAYMANAAGNTLTLGVGMGQSGIFFDGSLDAVAMYDDKLGTATLEAHLAALRPTFDLELENLQANHPSLAYHWPFEGVGDEQRLWNWLGVASADLRRFTNGTPADTQSWVGGCNGQGYASRSHCETPAPTPVDGVALMTRNAISLGAAGTIEFLVRPGRIGDQGSALGGVGAGTTRWYFLQDAQGYANGNAMARIGSGGSWRPLVGTQTSVAYATNRWYYVAHTWSIANATNMTLNSYVADLSRKNPPLVHVVTNLTDNMGSTSGNVFTMGLGTAYNAGSSYLYEGDLDAVAVFNTILGKTELEARVADAFHVPPGGTVVVVR